jgi:translation initiation factor IF-3
MAQEQDLDLVEFSPSVCKIIDYEKFRYTQIKHDKKRSQPVMKEIQIRTSINEHDLTTKIGSIRKFLAAGDSVKLIISSKGRQISHPELNINILRKIMNEFKDVIFDGVIQSGRQLSCMCRKNK